MKGKTGIVVLVVVCIALGVGLLIRHAKAVQEQQDAEAKIMTLSNQWVKTEGDLNEQRKVNATMEKTLETKSTEAESLSNKLENLTATLVKTEEQAKTAAQQAKDEIAKRDAKIADLEGKNDDLTKQMSDLNTSINNLESQIADTQKRLAASEGDREYLLKELKRLQAEKAELERKFNDLAVLRDQVRKLRDELSIARRLEWIRRGLYGSEKGAEKLQKGLAAAGPQTNYDLNVEIKQSGGAKIAAPATNSPAAATPATNNPAPPK
jgi:chromosome segregation ATPase